MLKGSNIRCLHLEGHHFNKAFRYNTALQKSSPRSDQKELSASSNCIQTERHQATTSIKTGSAYIWPSKPVEASITPQTFSVGIERCILSFYKIYLCHDCFFFLFVLIHFLVGTCVNTCIAWLASIHVKNWFLKKLIFVVMFKKNKIENAG